METFHKKNGNIHQKYFRIWVISRHPVNRQSSIKNVNLSIYQPIIIITSHACPFVRLSFLLLLLKIRLTQRGERERESSLLKWPRFLGLSQEHYLKLICSIHWVRSQQHRKTQLNKFERLDIMQSMFLKHSAIISEIMKIERIQS